MCSLVTGWSTFWTGGWSWSQGARGLWHDFDSQRRAHDRDDGHASADFDRAKGRRRD